MENLKLALHQTPVSDVQQLILDEISSVRREVNSIKKNSINPDPFISPEYRKKINEAVQIYIDYNEVDDEITELLSYYSFQSHLEKYGITLNQETKTYIYKLLNDLDMVFKSNRVVEKNK